MANIINQILEIDKLAVEKLDEANRHKSDVLLEIEKMKTQKNDELQEQATSRIEKAREVEKAYAQSKIEKIKQNNDKLIDSLNENYERHHLQWEEDIISSIIG